jgi:hypothetical protein
VRFPLVFAIFLTALSSFATDTNASHICSDGTVKPIADVDLRASLPPIPNQDGTGWCYAYGAAAQVTYWALQNHVPGVELPYGHYVSAAAAAIHFNREQRNEEYGRTAAGLVLKRASDPRIEELNQQEKALSEKLEQRSKADQTQFSSDPEYSSLKLKLARVQTELNTIKEILKKLEYHEPDVGSAAKLLGQIASDGLCLESQVSSADNVGPDTINSEWMTKVFDHAYGEYLATPSDLTACNAAFALQEVFPALQISEIRAILSHSDQDDPMEKLWEKSCKDHPIQLSRKYQIHTVPEVISTEPLSKPELFKQVQSLLDSKIPVGITYHAEILNVGPEVFGKQVTLEENHYSLVVGKRFDCESKKTVYILRNSWGADSCKVDRGMFQRYSSVDGPVSYRTTLHTINSKESACSDQCPRYVNTGPSHLAALKRASDCQEQCIETKYAESIELNQPPFTCDQDDYVISEDQLMLGALNATYIK